MGTSGSSKGPKSTSPLVPDYADATPGVPLPAPEGQRFRGFRTEFGHLAAGSGGASLRTALGKYARQATHGAAVGPRRFGPAYTAGAELIGALGDLRAGGTGENATGTDLSRLVGQPMDYAAQEIARALAPDNADADQIAAAIQEAIAETLPEVEVFDPSLISLDQMIQLMVEFFSRILFQEITNSAGDAWNKSPTPQQTARLEAELLELVRVTVDKHLSPPLSSGLERLSKAQIETIERTALQEVWREWEAYQ